MSRRFMLHAPQDLRLESFTLPPIGPNEVHLRSRLGAISTGTESAWYFGTDPQLDPNYKNIRFPHPTFPRFLGYEKVAEVVALGAAVTNLKVGQRVIANYGHADEYIWPAKKVAPIPDAISDEEAIFATLMNVASHGVRRSKMQLGDTVLITGQGIVGLATLICARLAGAGRIIVTDRYDYRLQLASQFGADVLINASTTAVSEAIVTQFGPSCIDVVLECSSSYSALVDGMAVTKRNGKVCVVAQLKGDYPKHPVLGVDFHLGELEMISADGSWALEPFARWFFGAIERGAIQNLPSLISQRVPFAELDSGFQLLAKQPETVVKVVVSFA
ncbi:MAG: zinc-binding alcohol dehydrogenase [Chloroflexota bacterium]